MDFVFKKRGKENLRQKSSFICGKEILDNLIFKSAIWINLNPWTFHFIGLNFVQLIHFIRLFKIKIQNLAPKIDLECKFLANFCPSRLILWKILDVINN